MRVEYIIIIVVAMILMVLFMLMIIFRKKIFNFQKILVPKQMLSFSINDLISILGTKTNITMVKATLTRLRVTVKDLDEVDFVLLKTKFKLKDIGIVLQTVILPFGNVSLAIKDEMNKIITT
ncbi:PTS transporter subunit EIIB [Spiroplasma citri]|uniref:PTS sugar transporter n=1 Tax=Spiroplasma citri TaxID=2133 RepID=A0AAJ4EKJ3_SPICI|nr:PTS transporter subunit EIIB [Spiroplasma citri]APE75524.1 PTS glucose transporter subunit IIBC [Spiroplasma citri]QED25373.1 PTS sugar transporter [Spiroplasma citri]QIA67723.1 PTS sugar transporter [Spiroplasma citri]QIA69572.1 PTS sugar transporter [Spiroplasma citri]QIA71438.1 PTS transporter subunit EIIB [Spiroplasma citri]